MRVQHRPHHDLRKADREIDDIQAGGHGHERPALEAEEGKKEADHALDSMLFSRLAVNL